MSPFLAVHLAANSGRRRSSPGCALNFEVCRPASWPGRPASMRSVNARRRAARRCRCRCGNSSSRSTAWGCGRASCEGPRIPRCVPARAEVERRAIDEHRGRGRSAGILHGQRHPQEQFARCPSDWFRTVRGMRIARPRPCWTVSLYSSSGRPSRAMVKPVSSSRFSTTGASSGSAAQAPKSIAAKHATARRAYRGVVDIETRLVIIVFDGHSCCIEHPKL